VWDDDDGNESLAERAVLLCTVRLFANCIYMCYVPRLPTSTHARTHVTLSQAEGFDRSGSMDIKKKELKRVVSAGAS
jgi:hypothetical protein